MIRYSIMETEDFQKDFNKLPHEIKRRFRKQFIRVEENPFAVGKPLGNKLFRELKNLGYRTYFIIFETRVLVLFVGTSGKKDQGDKINSIKDSVKRFGTRSYLLGKIYKFGEHNDK